MKKLLVATHNRGKVAELISMLTELEVEVAGLDAYTVEEMEETGTTFAENAELKAVGYARQTGLVSLADDSGLVVDALGGRPGVYSARYGGDGLTFTDRMNLIIDELAEAGDTERRARFICVIAVAGDDGNILQTATGKCEGRIALEPRGNGGFGYDPIFIPDGFEGTFGELSGAIKGEISHRARAFREIIPFLRHFIAN